MKKAFLTLMVLGISASAFATELVDDPTISKFERGIICRAIDKKYPNTLKESKGQPGWLICREGGARFTRPGGNSDPGYIAAYVGVSSGQKMTCSARLKQSRVKPPTAIVACWQ